MAQLVSSDTIIEDNKENIKTALQDKKPCTQYKPQDVNIHESNAIKHAVTNIKTKEDHTQSSFDYETYKKITELEQTQQEIMMQIKEVELKHENSDRICKVLKTCAHEELHGAVGMSKIDDMIIGVTPTTQFPLRRQCDLYAFYSLTEHTEVDSPRALKLEAQRLNEENTTFEFTKTYAHKLQEIIKLIKVQRLHNIMSFKRKELQVLQAELRRRLHQNVQVLEVLLSMKQHVLQHQHTLQNQTIQTETQRIMYKEDKATQTQFSVQDYTQQTEIYTQEQTQQTELDIQDQVIQTETYASWACSIL